MTAAVLLGYGAGAVCAALIGLGFGWKIARDDRKFWADERAKDAALRRELNR